MGYAAGTLVSAERSRAEIETVVGKYAGRDAEFSSGRMAGMAAIMFVAHGRRVKFVVPLPTDEEAAEKAKRKNAARWRNTSNAQKEAWIEQETRRRWRCLLLAIKAKLETVESGIETFDEAFLAHVCNDSGQTVYEAIQYAVVNGQRLLPAVKTEKVIDISAGKAK
jgi:hypothetical protein